MKNILILLIVIVLCYSCSDDSTGVSEGTISGQVVSKTDGTPITSAFIQTIPATESLMSDSEGKFEIEVSPGEYTVKATKEGYVDGSVNVSVSAGKTVSAVIPLEEGKNIMEGLIAFYPFTGNANDAGSNSLHGEVNNATLTNDKDDNPNSAYLFNGQTSYIEVPQSSLFNFSGDFTITTWIKPERSNCTPSSTHIDIVSRWGCAQEPFMFGITSNLAFEFWTKNDGVTFVGADNCLPDRQWSHLAAVFVSNQGSNTGVLTLYVNGVLNQSGIIKEPIHTDSCLLKIGARANFEALFGGTVDEVYIFGRALSPDDVKLIMNK